MLLDLLFPKRCVGCRRFGSYFCENCILNIKQTDLVCPKCEKKAVGGQTHPICRRKFGLDGLWSLGVYQDPLREAIQQLKYNRSSQLGAVLVDILLEYWVKFSPFILDQIKKDQGQGWIVIPVPLHWYRQNWRGFNQAEILSQLLANKLGLEFANILQRTRYTKPQAKLKAYQRRSNIYRAFSLDPKYQIQNTKVLLIDDVWTTGATLKECGYILKRAGAKEVWTLTLAR